MKVDVRPLTQNMDTRSLRVQVGRRECMLSQVTAKEIRKLERAQPDHYGFSHSELHGKPKTVDFWAVLRSGTNGLLVPENVEPLGDVIERYWAKDAQRRADEEDKERQASAVEQ
ncbi:MAG: hypothetical protein GXP62_17080 [Oligoflexia bacterium]|nr:hypothetical protein [Oligoflexia bacterium]